MGTVKGIIECAVNKAKTTVSLIYTPKSPGEVWELKDVLDLLEKKGIVYGVNRESIQAALKQFGDKDEPTASGVVAQGLEPRLPSPSFTLSIRSMDDALKKTMVAVVRKAGPPRFADKVDPVIKEASYCEAGDVIGSFSYDEEGEPGRSVFDEGIEPVPGSGKGTFLVGKGIVRDGDDLTAEMTGFARQGENWVDFVPFSNHSWSFSLSKDETCLYLDFTPGMRSLPPPRGEELLEEARDTGYESLLIEGDVLDKIIKETLSSRKAAKISLNPSRDARVALETNPMKTKAELVLEKGLGKGKKLSLKEVSALLNGSGLKNIDPDKTKKEIMEFYNSSRSDARLLLCEGSQPQRGKDRVLNFSVPFLEDSYLELLVDKVELDTSLITMYKSFKDFPLDKIEKLALVEKDQRIFSLGAESLGKAGTDVFGKPIAGLKGNDPILNLYENVNYQKGNGTALISGILEIYQDEETHTCFARVREHANAPITVAVSENKMAAVLAVGMPRGTGFPADRKMILEALEKAGVTDGILDESVDQAAEASGLGEVLADQVVAEGRYPMDGSRELKLIHDIDFQDKKKNFGPIKAGEIVGSLHSDGNDTVGYTVTGSVLEKESEEDDLEIGENISQTETDEQDVISLKAQKSGRLIFTGTRLFIQDTVDVEGDFSPNMGRIDFPGNVIIQGSVLSRAMVNAGESIQVNGVIQAALVSAGDKIMVGKGIKGSQKAVLRARNLEFAFAEEANLMAVENVICRSSLMRCQVRCNGTVDISGKGAKIIGGELKVKNGILAETIGNERGVETKIHFGQDFLVEDRIAQLMRDLEKIQVQTLRVDEIIEKARGRPDKQDLMMKARDKKVRILKAMEKKNVKLFLLREKFEEHFESSIKVTGTLHDGTVFYSHGREYKIIEKKTSVEIYFDRESGKICERPLQ